MMIGKHIKIIFTVLFCLAGSIFVVSQNIAPQAKISASTEQSEHPVSNITDGIIRIQGLGEWASQGDHRAWGFFELPWIKLEWPIKRSIEKITLYDRPGVQTQIGSGTLVFSDGSKISVTAIPNDGSPKMVTFPAKEVEWVRFDVTDGEGLGMGLSEIEVFAARGQDDAPLTWVDPFIESAKGRYFFFTPGARPMGMVAAAPITRNKNQYGGGYNYNSTEILGFEQIHGWCLSGIQVMPTTGEVDPPMVPQLGNRALVMMTRLPSPAISGSISRTIICGSTIPVRKELRSIVLTLPKKRKPIS